MENAAEAGRSVSFGGMRLGAVVRRPRGFQVFMILLPALRFFTGPRPPGAFAARRLAAVILPPLLFFAMIQISFS